jgi:signal peptidase
LKGLGEVMNRIKKSLIYLIAAGILIAAVIFAVSRNPQKSFFGYRFYTVLTPSMEPELSVGDMVVVKLSEADDIQVGDVITFNPSSDSDAYLTHRVTQKLTDYEGSGVTCFITKGDANDDEDGFILDSSRVIGTVNYHIPKLGYVIRFIQLRWYFVVPLIIMLIVLIELLKYYFRQDVGAENDASASTPEIAIDTASSSENGENEDLTD